MVSLPAPAQIRSLPPSPLIVLFPGPATITSGALVPVIVAALETIVAGFPWQVGSPAPAPGAPRARRAASAAVGPSSKKAARAGILGWRKEGMVSIRHPYP